MHVPTLRERRIHRLWSQAELARRSGGGRATILSIETGQRLPRLQTMRRIAEALESSGLKSTEFRQAVEDREEKVAA